jgi:glycosyltransferase involved in cell wall biosynthesis
VDTPDPKRILVISPWKGRWSLGQGAGVADDHHFISELGGRGTELHFLVPRSEQNADLTHDNLVLHTYPNFFDATEWWPTALKRILWPLIFYAVVSTRAVLVGRKIHPDFVLGHSHLAAVPAYMCREFLQVPSGTKLFGVMDLVHSEWSRWKYYFKNIEQIFAMKVPQDVWIILDDGTEGRDAALRHGIPAEKICFLPNGVNVEWMDQPYNRNDIRRTFGIPQDVKVVLFLARLVDSKRPELVLRSIPQIKHRTDHPALFLFVGEGPARRRCEALAGELGITDSVRFVGAIPHRQVPEVMSASDVFVSTSNLTNAAIPTCEAMVCGLPVVVFDAGNTATVIEDGTTGLVVADGDIAALAAAIADLLGDDQKCRSLAQAAKSFAARSFTRWSDRVAMEIEVIRSVIRDKSR